MKVSLEIPVDDVPFILSGSLKGWLRQTSMEVNEFVPTDSERDAFLRLVESAVQKLEVQSMLELTGLVKS